MKESNKNIENSKKKNSLGYTVPSNYFDNFQKRLFSEIENKKHQTNLGFILPENYFEKVNKQILNNNKPKERKVISFLMVNKWLVSSVAASIAFLFLFNFINNSEIAKNQNLTNTNINLEIDSVQMQNDAILSSILVEDTAVNDYMDTYLLKNLVIKDILSNILSFDDATLATLFVEESNVADYIESYVIEDLIFDNIQYN